MVQNITKVTIAERILSSVLNMVFAGYTEISMLINFLT
jgi:hypothetical protein